jgi:acetolactate synthase-1/2/3 large subunit
MTQGHGGVAISKTLTALGVENLFALTGGHIFPILDGCHQDGIRIVDTRPRVMHASRGLWESSP